MSIGEAHFHARQEWAKQGFSTRQQWLGFAIQSKPTPESENRLVLFVASEEDPAVRRVRDTSISLGVNTRVVAVGRFSGMAATLNGGSSIYSRTRYSAGSFGSPAALLRNAADGSKWLLSANHIIALNRYPVTVNEDIRFADDVVLGTEVKYVQINADNNQVDAAVVKLTVDASVYTGFWNGFPCLGNDLTPIPAQDYAHQLKQGERTVCKLGAATGISSGKACYTQGSILVHLPHMDQYHFVNVFGVEAPSGKSPFGLDGDSGAMVVDRDTGRPVGLLFARAETGSSRWVAYIETALNQLSKANQTGPFSIIRG